MSHYNLNGRDYIPQGISIIMPSYNQGKYIGEAIESVLTQNIKNINLIIMDGGSTDETIDILRSYSRYITYESKPDNGQSHALNKALKYVKYDITGWLNADDLYVKGIFRKILFQFSLQPDLSLIHGQRILIDSSSACIGWSCTGPFKSSTGIFNIASETSFWRSNILNGLSFKEDLQFAMDLQFLGSISKVHKIHYLNHYIGCFRCHDDAKSAYLWESTGLSEAIRVYNELFGNDFVQRTKSTNSRSLIHMIKSFVNFLSLPKHFRNSYFKHKLSTFNRNTSMDSIKCI